MQLDGTCSESLGGSTQMPKMENWFGGGGPDFVALWRVHRRRVTSLTNFVWLRLSVSPSRDPGESSV